MDESVEDQIRHLITQYVQSHDGEDPDAVVACFTEDGRLIVPSGAKPQGRQAVREFMVEQYARRRAANKVMKHLYTNSNIKLDGNTATVVSDWVAYESVDAGPWAINMIGQSVDRVVRQDGKWLLAERHNIDGRFRPEKRQSS
jgi:uncharacterized protein (TIGR02246 family)